MGSTTAHESLLLLGQDHAHFGHVHVESTPDGRVAAAISVGLDRMVPSMRSKGDAREPNEDALVVLEDGTRTLVAVADAHWGLESSHDLVLAVRDRTTRIPPRLAELQELFRALSVDEAPRTHSRSAVAITVVDRDARQGFGLSVGDVSVVTVDDTAVRRHTVPSPVYVAPRDPGSMDPSLARPFEFDLSLAQRVLVFSDGIDECHYRSPATSIGPRHIHELYLRVGPDPETFTAALADLALEGVDGNPGGEDNLALVIVATDPIR